MAHQAIDISNVVKVYEGKGSGPVRALDGLTLQVNQGEIFGLLGQNGAGKTTLLRILTTLITPTSGEIRVLGMDLGKNALEIRKNICVVLQENAVELFLSVQDNLDTYARFHSIPAAERRRRIDQAIAQFGLGEYRNQKVIDLSGGLKRRVQVAKVFMVDKPVIFLDEATTGMDPINKRATLDAIREQTRKGRTIFLTTHILQEAEELCDTIAIIDHGKLVRSGDVQTIKSLASSAFDVTMTFDTVTDDLVAMFGTLHYLKLERKNNTIRMTVTGQEAEALELIARIIRTNPLVHFEASSATLEDAFIELLGGTSGAGS